MIAAFLFAAGQFYAQPARKVEPHIENRVPQGISGWAASSEDSVYSAVTLHEYIDGACEIYRALNVCRVVARRYAKEGFPPVTADIFEMKTSADAYGAYHHDIREGEEVGIGRESEYEGATLAFWKGSYVVYVSAASAPDPVRDAILSIGKAIARAIPEDPPPPALLKYLPKEGLIAGDTHYFHDHFLLNLYYFIADDNLLNLSGDTEGVLAHYKTKHGAPLTCLVIRYPGPSEAEAARGHFAQAYLADADDAQMGKTENGRWVGARVKDSVLCVIFDAPEREDALNLLHEMTRERAFGGAKK